MRIILAANEEVDKLHSIFKKFNTQLLEEPETLYPYGGIIDVYDRVLTEQEASTLLQFPQHNKTNGPRFISAFMQLFHNSDVYVLLNKKEFSKSEIKQKLSSLNKTEASHFRKWFSTNKGIYKIEDEEALKFFANLSIHEVFFTNFFFPSLETVIIGNYDLSLPIYCKTSGNFEICKEIIEENGLFIRGMHC
ncbi:hypothetical protein JOC77_001643 [Peribacillus deserti]|uniref:Uncharacterized protein n=1 Tax=Peribacillus deserti TaxID=673318 RepID=A0ABS2QIU0_9BACI|nr:hypothetical protein [Peribacillus deserti]MBM7692216.1 hypothetical protein [Peribacillus deserti]